MSAYQKLVERFQQLYKLSHASTFLSWDQMVMMPERGNDARAAAIAEIAGLQHALLTAPELADWLEEAEQQCAAAADSEQQQLVSKSLREMRRRWSESNCLPAELVKSKIVTGSRCEHGWRSQRKDNDWQGFLSNFKEVVAISREEAGLRQQAAKNAGISCATPYEAMLELHCAGDSQALIDTVFARLREELPGLLQQVIEYQRSSRQVPTGNASAAAQGYPIDQQKKLSECLMASLGFDFSAGRLDVSMHPFSTGVPGDLRITTRYSEGEFIEGMLATAHETGHASYEGGLPPSLSGLPVGDSRNMSIHESQSLLFEKQLFLSKPFSDYFTSIVHRELPATQPLSAQGLWQQYSQVQPGYIRVEADEVCYPLHVMLRYEIESALINGAIEAEHIPDLWNEKMQRYLGLSTEGDYNNGCLQDIHWTDGAFGYFPSYTLGALNAAQIFATIRGEFSDWQERLRTGDVDFIRHWLEQKIWSQGCLLQSQELMASATGEATNADYFLQHLKARYLHEQY